MHVQGLVQQQAQNPVVEQIQMENYKGLSGKSKRDLINRFKNKMKHLETENKQLKKEFKNLMDSVVESYRHKMSKIPSRAASVSMTYLVSIKSV